MRPSSHAMPRAERATRLERMRWLVQPAALWIGVLGALVHIALSAPVGAPVGSDSSVSGLQCDESAMVEAEEAVAIAEELLLGAGATDQVGLTLHDAAGRVVWLVIDQDEHASIELDACTGEVVAFER